MTEKEKEKNSTSSSSSSFLLPPPPPPSTTTGPFCHRVLLAAGEKQVPITLGYIDFAAKPEW